jgi:drug/metabolite transporter (DMT)-like permease
MLMFIAATMLPISFLMILIQTSPLWTSILGYFVNGERILKLEYVAMAISFFGVSAIALSKRNSDNQE